MCSRFEALGLLASIDRARSGMITIMIMRTREKRCGCRGRGCGRGRGTADGRSRPKDSGFRTVS